MISKHRLGVTESVIIYQLYIFSYEHSAAAWPLDTLFSHNSCLWPTSGPTVHVTFSDYISQLLLLLLL